MLDTSEHFMQSEAGVHAALEAYEEFSAALNQIAQGRNLNSQRSDTLRVIGGLDDRYALCGYFVWSTVTLDGAYLFFNVYDGFPDVQGFEGMSYGPGRQLSAVRYEYRPREPAGPHRWIALDGEEGDFDPEQLAEHVIAQYMATSK